MRLGANLLIPVLAVAILTGGLIINEFIIVGKAADLPPIRSSISGATLVPADQNWINISPDILPSSGNLNITWNFTSFDFAKYPDCYIRIYSYGHAALIGQLKLINPLASNKTGTRQIAYTGLPSGLYFLNLQCEVLNGEANTTVPYESINLDIVPVIVNSTVRNAASRNIGMVQARKYYTCEWRNGPACNSYNWTDAKCRYTAPINCPVWQAAAAQGRSWNTTLGVPI
jgi:hypothetical protein